MTTELTGAEKRERIEQIRNGLTDKGWVDDIGSTRRNTIEVISFLLGIIDDLQASNKSALDRVVEVEAMYQCAVDMAANTEVERCRLQGEVIIREKKIDAIEAERVGALSAYNVTKSDLDKAVAANRSLEAGYKEMEQQRNNLLANQRMMQLALNDWAKDVEALKQALLTVRACGYLAESEERVIDGVLNAH